MFSSPNTPSNLDTLVLIGEILRQHVRQLHPVLFLLFPAPRHNTELHASFFSLQKITFGDLLVHLLEDCCGHVTRRVGVGFEGLEDISGGDGGRVRAPRVIIGGGGDQRVADMRFNDWSVEMILEEDTDLISASLANFASGNTLMLIKSTLR